MADKPIIFNSTMVRALLDGRKTQTRRIAKITAIMGNKAPVTAPEESLIELEMGEFRRGVFHYASTGALSGPYRLPYATGDRLYVREGWTARMTHGWTISDARSRMYQEEILYRADGHESIDGWWPSIHMPREFSRLTLTVTDVRVQRLQDISEADAVAEGIERLPNSKGPNYFTREIVGKWSGSFNAPTAQEVFADLWESLHGPEAWDSNPWVAAYSFVCERRNIDDRKG